MKSEKPDVIVLCSAQSLVTTTLSTSGTHLRASKATSCGSVFSAFDAGALTLGAGLVSGSEAGSATGFGALGFLTGV